MRFAGMLLQIMVLAMLLVITPALIRDSEAGIRAGQAYSIKNADFTAGLSGWNQSATSGGPYFSTASAPQAHTSAVQANIPSGKQAWLWTTLPLKQTPSTSELGEKMEAGAWVYLPATASYTVGGSIRLQVYSETLTGSILVAESVPLDLQNAPRDQWMYIYTIPSGAYDARQQTAATQIKIQLRMNSAGLAYFDDLLAGKFEYSEYPLINGSFEQPAFSRYVQNSLAGWEILQGVASLNIFQPPQSETDAYYGMRYMKLYGNSATTISQTMLNNLGNQRPRLQEKLEAGAWLFLENDVLVNGVDRLEIKLLAHSQGAPYNTDTIVASKSWIPNMSDKGKWIFLHTDTNTSTPLPWDKSQLRIEISKTHSGTVRVDYLQVGSLHGINGNPRKQVSANYVGVYRSPYFPGATTNPSNPQVRWGNWYSNFSPACDSGQAGFSHNPDIYRTNGRRDVAVSTLRSIDDTPLVGAYDSRDRDVINLHLRLAKAMHIDRFNYDYYGHTIAQQNLSYGMEAVNEQALVALLDEAEQPDINFKISVMYEPKVPFVGWLANQPNTMSGKKAVIKNDLVYLVQQHFDRKAIFKFDGKMVVTLFGQKQCFDPGTGQVCLQDADWLEIKDHVKQLTGKELFLIGSTMPTVFNFKTSSWYPSSLNGLMQWKLVALPFLKFKTYDDIIQQIPSTPAAGVADLQAHANLINRLTNQWWQQNDSQRVQLAIVWPGFDDSGVAGWGATNLNGQDGQPLCLRIAEHFNGNFYQHTFAAALKSDPDWLEIATANDWNEQSRFDLRWNQTYFANVLAGQLPSAPILNDVFSDLLTTQGWIDTFKGATSQSDALQTFHNITRSYLLNPLATKYD